MSSEWNRILENHLQLPSNCPFCGKKCYYWVDQTYGCEDGHIIAYTRDSALFGTVWFWVDPQSSTGSAKT